MSASDTDLPQMGWAMTAGLGLDQTEVGDGVALVDQLGDAGVDLGAAVVVDLQVLDDRVLTVRRMSPGSWR